MKHWKTLLPALLLLTMVAVAPAAAAPPAPVPTLTGEVLSAFQTGGGVGCKGGSGSFTYTVSGTATGPYPGTFTETGTGTVTDSTLTAFSATFTIHAATGDVTGTKALTGTAPSVCYQGTNFLGVGRDVATTYQATIHTGHGNYTDHGTSVITQLFVEPSGVDLSETYTSSQAQATLIVPTSADQCKDGGYQNFPQFKNQGECVSFVANGK